MSKKQCPCQDPESHDVCSACEEQIDATTDCSVDVCYI